MDRKTRVLNTQSNVLRKGCSPGDVVYVRDVFDYQPLGNVAVTQRGGGRTCGVDANRYYLHTERRHPRIRVGMQNIGIRFVLYFVQLGTGLLTMNFIVHIL